MVKTFKTKNMTHTKTHNKNTFQTLAAQGNKTAVGFLTALNIMHYNAIWQIIFGKKMCVFPGGSIHVLQFTAGQIGPAGV